MLNNIPISSEAFTVPLSKWEPHNGALIAPDSTLRIRTPTECWSYATSADVSADFADARMVLIEVSLACQSEVAVALLDRTGNGVVEQETVPESHSITTIYICTTRPNEVARLMIRTGALPGPVDVRLYRVKGWRFKQPPALADLFKPAPLLPDLQWSRAYGKASAKDAEAVLRAKLFDLLEAPLVVPWLEGAHIVLWPGEQMSRAVAISGIYEPNTLLVMRWLINRGAIVLDVGANSGLFTAAAAAWVGPTGRVIAVEPSPREIRKLKRVIAENPQFQIELSEAALADTCGTGVLQIAENYYAGLNTIGSQFAYPGVTLEAQIKIPLMTVDSLVSSLGLQRLDVIKADIEGAEVRMLQGANATVARFRPQIIFEFLPAALEMQDSTTMQMYELFKSQKYSLFSIEGGLAKIESIVEIDLAAGRNLLALPVESELAAAIDRNDRRLPKLSP